MIHTALSVNPMIKKSTFLIKQTPRSIKKILSQLYSKIYYDQRLKQRGHNQKLNYAETNIAKLFLCLINKHFPPTCIYRKVFNRITIKKAIRICPTLNQKLKYLAKEY